MYFYRFVFPRKSTEDIETGFSTSAFLSNQIVYDLIRRPSSLSMKSDLAKPVKTQLCSICIENVPLDTCLHSCNSNYSHMYCKNCLASWCQSQINDGVTRLHCPNYQTCHSEIRSKTVDTVLDESFKSRLVHLRLVKTDPNYRECPR